MRITSYDRVLPSCHSESTAFAQIFACFCEILAKHFAKKQPMPTKLFVGNISDSCSEGDLKEAFEKYGTIVESSIVRNYAFVHFEKKEDADKAIKELHETELKGNVIRVLLSTTPHKKGRGSGEGRAPYPRDRDRQGYSRGPPSRGWGYPPPDQRSRYHPYYDRGDYYRGGYPPQYSRGSGGPYGYYSTYDSDYSRDYPRSYASFYGDRYGGAVTYPDTSKRQSWDR